MLLQNCHGCQETRVSGEFPLGILPNSVEAACQQSSVGHQLRNGAGKHAMLKLNTTTFSSILLAVSSFAALPASAADLPVKARPMAPVAAFSWNGCYIGANGGWVGQRVGYDTSPAGAYTTAAGFLAPPNAAGTGLLAGDFATAQHSYRADGNGGTFGGQIGCNMQFGGLVLGVEGDLNWANATTSV